MTRPLHDLSREEAIDALRDALAKLNALNGSTFQQTMFSLKKSRRSIKRMIRERPGSAWMVGRTTRINVEMLLEPPVDGSQE